MSTFYVRAEGDIWVAKGTPMPGHCPECPAYIPLKREMTPETQIKCWNCGLQGEVALFIEMAEYQFTPALVM